MRPAPPEQRRKNPGDPEHEETRPLEQHRRARPENSTERHCQQKSRHDRPRHPGASRKFLVSNWISHTLKPVTTSSSSKPASARTTEKIDLFGVLVSVLDLNRATRAILDALETKTKGYICHTSVHGLVEAQDDPAFRDILNDALLCNPDGMPVVWSGRFFHGSDRIDRVYGPDLMWEIFRSTEHQPVRHFLYGGGPGVAEQLTERLLAHFPGATIAGSHTPPFRPLEPSEEARLNDVFNNARPDIIWVGLGTPKQERFMAEYLEHTPATLMISVGAAFDLHAGLLPQAPLWMQRHGLEWFHRLTLEPARLWPRYRHIIPRFPYLFAKQLFKSCRAK